MLFKALVKDDGFTLLEALLASVIVSMVALACLSSFMRTAALVTPQQSHLARIEFARSILEEYAVIGKTFETNATYESRFEYVLAFNEITSLEPTRYDSFTVLEQVTVTVTDLLWPTETSELSQVFFKEKSR